MILSMTGFAATTREITGGVLSLELRAVNHRYLDIQLRIPEELRVIEPQIRELIASKASRGKVECRVGINQIHANTLSNELNQPALDTLLVLAKQVQSVALDAKPLSVGELLRWPGIVKIGEMDPEVLQSLTLEALGQALEDFKASRAREGEKLKAILLDRLNGIENIVETVKPKLPLILKAHMDKLTERLREVLDNVDDDRIKQEFALFAQKMDVDEELSRLTAHIAEVRRILAKGGQTGKRMDFLMQELNREANTLGSKSVSSETTQASVELKVLIEQMREQIQNIE